MGISVSVVSDYRLYDRGSIPGKDRISPLASVSRPALRLTQHPIQWVMCVLLQGQSTDHSPPSSAEVKNE
jgi:hypothetical protein